MKLWLLRPNKYDFAVDELTYIQGTAWDPWFDKAFGFVVRAKNENEARIRAQEQAGDEGDAVWLSSEFSTCTELTADGEPAVVIRDFAAA